MVVYVAVVATKQYNKLLITRVYLKHWEYIFNLTFTTIGQWNGNMASFASARQMAGTENDVYRTSWWYIEARKSKLIVNVAQNTSSSGFNQLHTFFESLWNYFELLLSFAFVLVVLAGCCCRLKSERELNYATWYMIEYLMGLMLCRTSWICGIWRLPAKRNCEIRLWVTVLVTSGAITIWKTKCMFKETFRTTHDAWRTCARCTCQPHRTHNLSSSTRA